MRNGIWVIVLVVQEGHGAGHSALTPSLLREQLERAVALAPRLQVCAVLTKDERSRLEGPLWFLPRSNVFARPEQIGTAAGILLALLRILERDPGARVVLLPSSQQAHDEEAFRESLLNAAADVAHKPENVILLSVEPDAAHHRIVVGRARALLKLFEPEMVAVMQQVVERAPDVRGNPSVAAQIRKRLTQPRLDFHRHVLPGLRSVRLGTYGHLAQRS